MVDRGSVAADQAPAAKVPVTVDALLDAITAIKARQKDLEQDLQPLLEALSAAMESGALDPCFGHRDWSFTHNAGRLRYQFPEAVETLEQQLKAAQAQAIQNGSATEQRGKPFWTIRPPKASSLPF